MVVVTAALLLAFALLLWAFAVLLSDVLEERTPRRWLRVALVAMLAPVCALTAAVVSAVAGLALVTALEPGEVPMRTGPETTTFPQPTTVETATPSAVPSPSASPSATPSSSASSSASPSP